MRPQDQIHPVPPDTESAARFDRIWSSTRPDAPSSAALDVLWARASVELDRIESARRAGAADSSVIPIGDRRARRRWITVGVVLAQAAAVLAGVGIALHRPGSAPTQPVEVARRAPRAVAPILVGAVLADSSMVDVGVNQFVVVRIDDHSHRVEQVDQAPMFPTMAEYTAHDFFDALEIAATP